MTRLEPQKYFPTVVVEDVYLHPCCDGASGIRGATSTRRACGGKNCDGRVKGTLCLVRDRYAPLPSFIEFNPTPIDDDAPLHGAHKTNAKEASDLTITVRIADLVGCRRHYAQQGDASAVSFLVFMLRGGVAVPPLFFHGGGIRTFTAKLSEVVQLTRDKADAELFRVTSRTDVEPIAARPSPGGQDSGQHWWGLSGIKNFGWNTLTMVSRLAESLVDRNRKAAPPSEQEHGHENTNAQATAYLPPPVPERPDTTPLAVHELESLRDEAGRFTRSGLANLKGLAKDLRKEVWPYLLGHWRWDMTPDENRARAAQKRERYTAIRSQWATVDAEQEARCTEFREQKSLIQRDVVRTDRRTVYFGSADHGAEHLRTLEDVLLTYVQWNQDLGYMQGMNDIAAVFLETLGDAADTFWCFAGWMEALQENFTASQRSVITQMHVLGMIVKVIDKELYTHLESVNALDLSFCYRWLLLRFKRETADFDATKRLWEAMWTCPLTRHFHLFLAAAMLVEQHARIVEGKLPLEGIVELFTGDGARVSAERLLIDGLRCYTVFTKIADVNSVPWLYLFNKSEQPA